MLLAESWILVILLWETRLLVGNLKLIIAATVVVIPYIW